jgi:hypothetical protein
MMSERDQIVTDSYPLVAFTHGAPAKVSANCRQQWQQSCYPGK